MKPSLLLAVLCLATGLSAQRVSVTHSATDTVRQGEVFSLTFAFDNVSAAEFRLPELVGLVVAGGPSRQSRMRLVNGVASSAEAYTYRVVADQPGLAYVPSVSGTAADSTYASEPVTLFVTADPDYVPSAASPMGTQPERPVPPTPPRRKRPTTKM